MKKTRFTIQQHEKLGKELQIIRDRILQIGTELANSYPISAGFTKLTDKSLKCIDELRNKMDSAVFNELGEKSSNETCKIYYRASFDRTPDYNKSTLVVELDR